MGFHKYTFYTRSIPQCEQKVKQETGWTDESYTYGFSKFMDKFWVATDLATGARITKGKTRKECAEWIQANETLILNRRKQPIYSQMVMEFKEILKEIK